MALRVVDWYDAVKRNEVVLISGQAGLNRPVCRAHIVEKAEFSDFLEGNEVIFITGVALTQPDELGTVIRNCREAGVAAVVVNLGRYIHAVPEEVVRYCDRNELALFTVPWHIHIETLMQKVFQMVAEESSSQSELESLFQNAVQFPERQELYVGGLKQRGFATEWRYCVSLLHIEPVPGAGDLYGQALQTVRNGLVSQGRHGFAYRSNQTLILFFANHSAEDVEEFLKEIVGEIARQLPAAGQCFFSVGRCTKSIRCLQKSYALAEKILTLQLRGQLPEDLHAYNKLGIYKMIIGLENQDILNEIHEEYLEPLLAYDKACGTDYAAFLRNYLKYDGCIQDIAKKMFIHRNTVHYRIRKIEEILDCDLQRTDTKMYLLIAVMSYQLRTGL